MHCSNDHQLMVVLLCRLRRRTDGQRLGSLCRTLRLDGKGICRQIAPSPSDLHSWNARAAAAIESGGRRHLGRRARSPSIRCRPRWHACREPSAFADFERPLYTASRTPPASPCIASCAPGGPAARQSVASHAGTEAWPRDRTAQVHLDALWLGDLTMPLLGPCASCQRPLKGLSDPLLYER